MNFFFQKANEFRDLAYRQQGHPEPDCEGVIPFSIGSHLATMCVDPVGDIKEFYDREGQLRMDSFVRAYDETMTDSQGDKFAQAMFELLTLAGQYKIDIDWHLAARYKYNELLSKKKPTDQEAV